MIDRHDADIDVDVEPGYERAGNRHAPAGDADLRDYFRTLYRRRWIALPVFLLVVAAAAAYGVVATPMYEGHVKLLIEPENPNVVSFKEVLEQDTAKLDYYQTQQGILRSRTLARRTLDALKLWKHPEFSGQSEADWQQAVTRALSGAIARLTQTRRPADAERPAPSETAVQTRAINAFLQRLSLAFRADTRLVEVKFRSADPALAAAAANALARAYIDQNLEFRFQVSKEASDWLNQRLAEQRKQVEASELALQQYREQNAGVSVAEQQEIVVKKLTDLSAAATRAKTERIEAEAVYNQLRAVENYPAALDGFPSVLSNPFLQRLKTDLAELQRQHARLAERLGDRHPEIIRLESTIRSAEAKLQTETAKVVQSVRNEALAAQARERSLSAALEAHKTEALAINRKAIEYGVLEREATSNRHIFEALLQRTKETSISSELKTGNVRVVDAAEVPFGPVWPRTRLILLLAILLGAPLAVGLAFGVDMLDERIKSPQEIRAQLGVPFLGFAPLVPRRIARKKAPLLNNGVPAEFSEAFRTIRANVSFFPFQEERGRSLLITSTEPDEGKTLVASNLAAALARIGRRVLLVDADMRSPRVHAVFGRQREPGLANVLLGSAELSAAMAASEIPGLMILAAGPHPESPVDLLEGPEFQGLMASLRDQFDWVVIDSPPIMAVTDPIVVARAASGAVLVVGRTTSRRAAQAALDQLDAARVRVIGAVWNRIDLKRDAYLYAPYSRREYTKYYRENSHS